MKSLGCMMADGGAQILQITPGAAPVAALLSVRAALLAIDLAKRLRAPPVVQSLDPLLELPDGHNRVLGLAVHAKAVAELLKLEALNWSGMEFRAYAAAMQLSPHSPRKLRDQLDTAELTID